MLPTAARFLVLHFDVTKKCLEPLSIVLNTSSSPKVLRRFTSSFSISNIPLPFESTAQQESRPSIRPPVLHARQAAQLKSIRSGGELLFLHLINAICHHHRLFRLQLRRKRLGGMLRYDRHEGRGRVQQCIM